jgi:Fe-S-cluster-containing dehydrogenase component
MAITRRNLLKGLATAGAAAALPRAARAEGAPKIREPMMGMLFDATLCIGCKACMVACREANGVALPPDTTLWDQPEDLSANAKNVIQLFRGERATPSAASADVATVGAADERSCFVKRQCMHCVDPACVGACMLGALQKRGVGGAVTWDSDLCVGCRYCQVVCPFDVPKFEWQSNNPHIVKCELCNHRLEQGGQPACTEVCPRQAVIYGRRSELLGEAKRRIAAEPAKYNPKVYGEHDAGGTQVLYLAPKDIQFAELGLPDLGERALPERVRGVQGVIYKGFAAPVALYAILGAAVFRNHRQQHEPTAGDPAAADTAQERQP